VLVFVSVTHRISDPVRYFQMVAESAGQIPADLRLPQYFASDDHRTMVCLWETPSVERLKDFLEPLSQGLSTNEYAAVDVAASSGLPAPEAV
jgi:hypothetical protein